MPAIFVTVGWPVPALRSATMASSSAMFAPYHGLLVGVEPGGERLPVDFAEVLERVEPLEYLLYPYVHRRPPSSGPTGGHDCDSQVVRRVI